jgi:hypothetical protein
MPSKIALPVESLLISVIFIDKRKLLAPHLFGLALALKKFLLSHTWILKRIEGLEEIVFCRYLIRF